MDKYEEAERRRRELNRHRIALVTTDLNVAMKSVERANEAFNLGHYERASELLVSAREIHDRVVRFLLDVDDTAEQQLLREQNRRVADSIKEIETRSHPPQQSPTVKPAMNEKTRGSN